MGCCGFGGSFIVDRLRFVFESCFSLSFVESRGLGVVYIFCC